MRTIVVGILLRSPLESNNLHFGFDLPALSVKAVCVCVCVCELVCSDACSVDHTSDRWNTLSGPRVIQQFSFSPVRYLRVLHVGNWRAQADGA